jgi:hypothetical protein
MKESLGRPSMDEVIRLIGMAAMIGVLFLSC